MWCDDFDMDLPRVLPEARALVGDLVDVRLLTHCHAQPINCPSAWNTSLGTTSFFALDREPRWEMPRHYYAPDPLVPCTFWELLRDEWSHQSVVLVDGRVLWRPDHLEGQFQRIMYDLRGWCTYRTIARDKQVCLRSIERACKLLRLAVSSPT